METLVNPTSLPSLPAVDFSWVPTGPALSFVIGNTVYSNSSVDPTTKITPPEFATPQNTALTFTANVNLPAGLTILEYHWYFGDGREGYGSPIVHTYVTASPQTRCTLEVMDDLRRKTYAAHMLNLQPAELITVTDNIRV